MQQLCFTCRDINQAKDVYQSLMTEPQFSGHVHLLCSEETNTNLPKYNFLSKTDIFHSGTIGAIIGFIVAALISAALSDTAALSVTTNVLLAIFCSMFGAWLGGFRGFQELNHRFQSYQRSLSSGEMIMVLDCPNRLIDKATKLAKGAMHNRYRANQETLKGESHA